MDQHIVNAWAAEYVQLEARIADLEAERDAYQEIARAALDQLHSTTMALNRTRTQLYRLTEQIRAHRHLPEQPSHTTTRGKGRRTRFRSIYRPTAPDPSREARL